MNTVAHMSDYQQTRKQLDVTPDMLAQIQFIAGSNLQADDVVVFEATAVNTYPLSKSGSIFDQGVLTRTTLVEMAERLNNKTDSVPLHTLHLQGDELPIGRVFHGYVQDLADGQSELRAQFFIAKSEAAMIEKINLGILDEVSIGLKSKQLLCSKCGFDYFGATSTMDNLWDRVCQNDHVLGENGAHVILSGVDSWLELSLVSRGAARKAKIHGRVQKVMSQDVQDRIAASGFSPDAVTLFASPQPTKEEPNMADKTPVTPVVVPEAPAEFDAKVSYEALSAKLDQVITALTPKELGEPVVVLTEPPVTDAALEALKTELAELKASIAELGKTKVDDLTSNLPVGGVSGSAITDAASLANTSNFSAFKTARK